jgi:hypothetical protein
MGRPELPVERISQADSQDKTPINLAQGRAVRRATNKAMAQNRTPAVAHRRGMGRPEPPLARIRQAASRDKAPVNLAQRRAVHQVASKVTVQRRTQVAVNRREMGRPELPVERISQADSRGKAPVNPAPDKVVHRAASKAAVQSKTPVAAIPRGMVHLAEPPLARIRQADSRGKAPVNLAPDKAVHRVASKAAVQSKTPVAAIPGGTVHPEPPVPEIRLAIPEAVLVQAARREERREPISRANQEMWLEREATHRAAAASPSAAPGRPLELQGRGLDMDM